MPKKRVLGCSFPVLIGFAAVFVGLLVVGVLTGPMGKNLLGLPAWLIPAKPHPELPAEVVFHLFSFPITNSIIATWVTIIFLVGVSFLVTRRLTLVPGRRQSLLEFILEALLNFCKSVAGEKNGRRFFPIVATIFLFVGFNAWLNLLPGYGSILLHTSEGEVHLLRGANTDINTPLAVALISFVFVEYFGLRALGFRYLKKFINVGGLVSSLRLIMHGKMKAGFSGLMTGLINVFIGVLETLSEFIRIVSFTFRLFGNMTAGEILLMVAVFLIPWAAAVVFYGLELLVGFVQSLIFAGLTLIFMTIAVAAHGEHSGESAHH
ncbi:MAG: FoF1 ATP synthase subunit a [Dehalococcoidales bacterium]|nr:FoF1 ATP synthase subunit a [Dehalococcoidales bacterium]MDP6738289.1 FoF1 ATP synthase subunit a [Dehalococcoidales bacterium]